MKFGTPIEFARGYRSSKHYRPLAIIRLGLVGATSYSVLSVGSVTLLSLLLISSKYLSISTKSAKPLLAVLSPRY